MDRGRKASRCPGQNLNKGTGGVRVRALGVGSRQRIQVSGGGEGSVFRESYTQNCGLGDLRPTQETAGVYPAQAYPQFPAAPLGRLQVSGLKCNPTPGRAGRRAVEGWCRWAGRGRVRRLGL